MDARTLPVGESVLHLKAGHPPLRLRSSVHSAHVRQMLDVVQKKPLLHSPCRLHSGVGVGVGCKVTVCGTDGDWDGVLDDGMSDGAADVGKPVGPSVGDDDTGRSVGITVGVLDDGMSDGVADVGMPVGPLVGDDDTGCSVGITVGVFDAITLPVGCTVMICGTNGD